MNSSGTERTVSLRRLMNRRVFPILAATTLAAVFAATTGSYFSLKAMIPVERLPDARHVMFVIGLVTTVTATLGVGAILAAALFIDRHVTLPVLRLADWAELRFRSGEGPSLRTRSRIAEIGRLASVFGQLFDEQLKRVRELRTLIGATRHNLCNHIANIGSNAQFAKDGKRDVTVAAEKTLREVETVLHILDVNADIAKNYSHILGEKPSDVQVADLVHSCLDQLETSADEKGVTLDADIPPRSLVAVAHRRNLESVIHNLVENAIKYTPRGGSVSFAVREYPAAPEPTRPDAKASAPSQLEIVVADTGMGIPDADKPHVFEREYRARSVRHLPGDGYGLAFVDSVVALYGGTVEIKDNYPSGTVFTIRLPLPIKHTK